MNKEIQFLMYGTPQGDVNVEAVVRDETLWLTQKAMAQLFGVQVPAISKHLKNIFAEGELHEEVVVSKMEINHSALLLRVKHRLWKRSSTILMQLFLSAIE